MISSFMTHSGDCGQMASAVDAAAAAHSPALLRVQAGLAALPADRYSEAQLRLEHTQGPKLVVMRQAMQKAVMSCGQDQRLVASLMRLSNLGKPSP
jgi:hypothetical protein